MGMQHHANTILEDIPIQIYIVYIWCVCTVIVRKCSHRSVCHIVRMLNRRRHPSNLRLGFWAGRVLGPTLQTILRITFWQMLHQSAITSRHSAWPCSGQPPVGWTRVAPWDWSPNRTAGKG